MRPVHIVSIIGSGGSGGVFIDGAIPSLLPISSCENLITELQSAVAQARQMEADYAAGKAAREIGREA